MMWIFEWDILTGDSAVLDVISSVTGDRVDEAVSEGHEAVADAERMRDPGRRHRPATWRDPAMREAFLGTLDYEVDTLRLLAEYRELVLRQGQWHATGSVAGRDAVVRRPRAVPDARGIPPRALPGRRRPPGVQPHRRRARHRPQRARPGDGVAGPGPARPRGGLARRRGGARRPPSRRGAALRRPPPGSAPPAPGGRRRSAPGCRACSGCCSSPSRLSAARDPRRADLVPRAGAPARRPRGLAGAASRSAGVLLRGRVPWGVVAALGGVLVARCALTLLAMSSTGPGGYWYAFWTEPAGAPLRHRRRGPLPVAARGGGLGAVGHARAPPGGRHRARRGRGRAGGTGLRRSAVVGLERALTAWNDQVGLLPWGLRASSGSLSTSASPADTAWWAAGVGARGARRGPAARAPGSAAGGLESGARTAAEPTT